MISHNSINQSSSYGENSDKVYPIGLCRGDLKPDHCVHCINGSIYPLIKECPKDREASLWTSDYCMLRYTNHSKQGDPELAPASTSCSTEDVSRSSLVVDGFNQRLLALLEVLRIEAAAGGW
ncbi:hypothetical protein CerSpe_050640 [Prunus speciosa]